MLSIKLNTKKENALEKMKKMLMGLSVQKKVSLQLQLSTNGSRLFFHGIFP
jgi:hypothetical protein